MAGADQTTWRAKLWLYAPLFMWVGVIFFLSSPEGAFNETSRIVGPLLHFFYPNISTETENLIHACVRKSAHFTEYGILAFLAVRAFSGSTSDFLRKWRYLLPLFLVALIASADEFNQSFEPSRTSSPWDVLLDVSGGIVVTFLFWCFLSRRRVSGATC